MSHLPHTKLRNVKQIEPSVDANKFIDHQLLNSQYDHPSIRFRHPFECCNHRCNTHKFCCSHPYDISYNSDDNEHQSQCKTHAAVINQLEENYWANWKPMNEKYLKQNHHQIKPSTFSAHRQCMCGCYSPDCSSKATDMGDVICEKSTCVKNNKPASNCVTFKNDITEPSCSKCTSKDCEKIDDVVPLKHTDSLILHTKRHREQIRHLDKPKYIVLRKKGAVRVIKGGTYPLQSCMRSSGCFSRPCSPICLATNRMYKTYQ